MIGWPKGAQRRQAILWVACILGVGCESGGSDVELTRSLTEAAEAVAPGQVLSLDRAAQKPWDTVVLVGPYTPVSLIEKAIGTTVPDNVRRLALEGRDDVNLLLFLSSGKVIAAVVLPRRVADFNKADLLRPVARSKSNLVRAATGVAFRLEAPSGP